jgi:hypothetical protein
MCHGHSHSGGGNYNLFISSCAKSPNCSFSVVVRKTVDSSWWIYKVCHHHDCELKSTFDRTVVPGETTFSGNWLQRKRKSASPEIDDLEGPEINPRPSKRSQTQRKRRRTGVDGRLKEIGGPDTESEIKLDVVPCVRCQALSSFVENVLDLEVLNMFKT